MRRFRFPMLLALAIASACPARSLITPEQARERAAALFEVSLETVSEPALTEWSHSALVYEMLVQAGSAELWVGLHSETGLLATYSTIPGDPELGWQVTQEEAVQIARDFCTAKEIPLPPDFALDTVVARDRDCAKIWEVQFTQALDGVWLPAYTEVDVDGGTGAVVGVTNFRRPLTISIAGPRLSAQEAQALAQALVEQHFGMPPSELVCSDLEVWFYPPETEEQRLQWVIAYRVTHPPLTFIEQELGLTEVTDDAVVYLDARTGEVLSFASPLGGPQYGAAGPAPKRPTAAVHRPAPAAGPYPDHKQHPVSLPAWGR